MKWPSSRAFNSRPRHNKTLPAAQAPVGNHLPSQRVPDSVHRAKWHQEITACRPLIEYLSTGGQVDITAALEKVQLLTYDYLYQRESIVLRSTECDELLDILISEYAFRDPSLRDVAVVACLHVLSVPAANRHFACVLRGDEMRYMRFLMLAEQISPNVLPHAVMAIVSTLFPLTSKTESALQKLQNFRQMIEVLGSQNLCHLFPLEMVHRVFVTSNIDIEKHVHHLFEYHQYFTAFKYLAWLKSVQDLPNSQKASVALDILLPSWRYLRIWEPKIARIAQFEQKGFSSRQLQKLSHILALEGPDTATQEKSSLRESVSESSGVRLGRTNLEMDSEELLDLLGASQLKGTHATDLYARLCPPTVTNAFDLSFLKSVLRSSDDTCCHGIGLLLDAIESDTGASHKLNSIAKALPNLKTLQSDVLHQETLSTAFGQLESLMVEAQRIFCQSLETGSAKHIGMLIHTCGYAILDTTSIHRSLSSEFLRLLQQLPSRMTVLAIFDRVRQASQQAPIRDCRFKKFLASALGGRPLALDNSITSAAIQNEIDFWRYPPDTTRKDLARALGKVKTVPYSLYTTWLLVILREDDEFIREVKPILMGDIEQAIMKLANLLGIRRQFNQLQDETWLLLFASLVQDRGPSYLRNMADSMPAQGWMELISNLSNLVESVRSRLPRFGAGLSQEQLDWWQSLSRRRGAVQTLLGTQIQTPNPTWLYFPRSADQIQTLLDSIERNSEPDSLCRKVLQYLSQDGENLSDLCDCIQTLTTLSGYGKVVFERQLLRHQSKSQVKLPGGALRAVFRIWIQERSPLPPNAKRALSLLEKLLALPSASSSFTIPIVRRHLQSQYELLIKKAGHLEKMRLRLNKTNSGRLIPILRRLEVENSTPGPAAQGVVPEELVDAVEFVGQDEYEVSFPLTGLNDLQRHAKGIPTKSRLLLLRLRLARQGSSFCIHFSPEEDVIRHGPWNTTSRSKPSGAICTTRPSIFIYYLGRNLHELLQSPTVSLQRVHSAVATSISAPPSTCIVCTQSTGIRLWKPAACSRNCSSVLRNAPLEVRLHNLLINPKAIDLLLTSMYNTSIESNAANFLPGCPVAIASIRAVIDSMPSLDSLQTATDLRSAIQGNDNLGRNREALLSWLGLRFRGFMLSSPDGFKIPSLGLNTEQFLVVNSSRDRELAFNAHYTPTGGSTVVFHGTRASRLFPILVDGLRIATTSAMRLNGAANGAGVYCGHDPGTSWGYAGSTGQSWHHSTLRNMNVLLGCELAPATPVTHGGVHVIRDENRLLVRYVFLLPSTFQPPVRAHVEPAMLTGIARLRAGLQP